MFAVIVRAPSWHTAGNNIVKESRALPVGAGVKLYTWHRRLDLRRCVETAAVQAANVALHLGGDE